MADRIVGAYENEDGEAYVPVADWPDEGEAAQGYADQTGLAVVSEGRQTVRTQDCECTPTSDSCPDDVDGQPCVVTERNECWVFLAFETDEAARRDLASWLADVDDKRVWEPAPRPVAPTSVGGSDG